MRPGIEKPRSALVHPKPEALARMGRVGRTPTALVGPSTASATATATATKRRRFLHRRRTGRELIGHVGHVANTIAGRRRRVDTGEG